MSYLRCIFSVFFVGSLSASAHDIGLEHEHIEDGWNARAGFVSDTDITARLYNTRGKSDDLIVERAIWLAEQYDLKRTPAQVQRAARARDKYEDAIVINSMLPTSVGLVGNDYESFTRGVRRNKDAGMTLASATVYAFPGAIPEGKSAYDVVAASDKVVRDQGLVKVDTTLDVRKAKASEKMAVMYNTQGADYVTNDLAHHARQSYSSGIRTMNLTYNNNNTLSGGGTKQDLGLTDLGKQWVQVAQAANIVIDVSHSSNQAAIDAAAIATKPIIASHSNARAIWNISRNISDEAIKAVGSTGGVVCPTGVGIFLNEDADASPERFVDHVVYIAGVIGKNGVCFSTDYVHNILDYYKRDIGNTDIYPPELGFGAPTSNIAAEHIWDVAAILEDDHGWTENEIRGFLGENVMRVYEVSWK